MHKYEIIETIGQGSFGEVFKARNLTTDNIVAMKWIKQNVGPLSAAKEISNLEKAQHPNVVPLLEVVRVGRSVYLVMEYFPMDLHKKLYGCLKSGKKLEPELVKSYMFQTTDAIRYCHDQGLMHRDLKPSNLLVNEKGIIKVADFGMACFFRTPLCLGNNVGTRMYRAPEVLLGSESYSCLIDIWAIGCIFAEMNLRNFLFYGNYDITQLYSIFKILGTPTEESWPGLTSLPFYQSPYPCWTANKLGRKVTTLDETGLDLLQKCLEYNPAARISAKKILEHNYFEGMKNTNAAT